MTSPPVANPTTAPATGFQFITSINTIQRDDETRRKVRSHARRQRLPNEPDHATTAPTKRTTQKERTSKFRLNPSSVSRTSAHAKKQLQQGQQSPKSSSPTSSTSGRSSSGGSSSADEVKSESGESWETEMITNELALTVVRELPRFAVLPIQTTPLTDNLFKYIMCVCLSPQEKFVQKWFDKCGAPTYFNTYHSSFLALSHAMNPQGNWWEFITVDQAMTHGFMGLVAAMHNALAGWDDMTTIDFHRYEAVKHINKRLNLEGRSDVSVSDGVMVTVSMLVQIEAFVGSLDAARAHMNGLKKMIDLRGGLIEGLGYSTLLQRALAWADFAYASAASAPLSFPFIPKIADTLPVRDRFKSRCMTINADQSAKHLNGLAVQNPTVVDLFELLYAVTEAINTFEFAKLETLKGQRSQMSDSIYLMEYRLCKLEEEARSRKVVRAIMEPTRLLAYRCPFLEDSMQDRRKPADLSDSLVYASHLFLHLALRGQPPAAKRNRALTEGLLESLHGTLLRLDLLLDVPSVASTSPTTSDSIDVDVPPSEHSSIDSWAPSTSEIPVEPIASSSSPSSPAASKDHLHDDILLWVLFVGACVQMLPTAETYVDFGIVSVGYPRSVFLTALRKFCQMRVILDKEALVAKLKSVVWLDSWCEIQLDMVWALIRNDIRA